MFPFGHKTTDSSSPCFGQTQILSTIFLFRPRLGWVPGICWCIWKYCILPSPCFVFTSLIYGTCSCCQLEGKLEKYQNTKQHVLPNQAEYKGLRFKYKSLLPLVSVYSTNFSKIVPVYFKIQPSLDRNELRRSSAQFLVYSYQRNASNPAPGFIILNLSPVTLVAIKITSWVTFPVTKIDILLELVKNCYSLQAYGELLSLT